MIPQLMHRPFMRHPIPPALIYLAVLIGIGFTGLFATVGIVERFAARNADLQRLASLADRVQRSSPFTPALPATQPAGSPFLEGQSITVASAGLLHRITSAIMRAGGSVISSEVEPQAVPAKDGFLRAIANFELEQAALQQLLYDFEAGMPFLYIDQLSIYAPAPPNEGGRVRVMLGVSGMWRGEK